VPRHGLLDGHSIQHFDAVLAQDLRAGAAARQVVHLANHGPQSLALAGSSQHAADRLARHVDGPDRLRDHVRALGFQQAHGVLHSRIEHVKRVHDADMASRLPLDPDAVAPDRLRELSRVARPARGVQHVQHVDVAHRSVRAGRDADLRHQRAQGEGFGHEQGRAQVHGDAPGTLQFAEQIAIVGDRRGIRCDAVAVHPKGKGLPAGQDHVGADALQEPVDRRRVKRRALLRQQ
jgi:hypothetical protein